MLIPNPVGLGLAAGQFALGIGQMIGGRRAEDEAAAAQIYNATFQNEINKFRVDQQNKGIAREYTARIENVKNQISNNFLAFEASSIANQMRLNELNDRAAFESVVMKKMLAKAMGASAAKEVYGKGARRSAMIATLGNYGRTKATQAYQLLNEQTESQRQQQLLERRYKAANERAMASIAVTPMGAAYMPGPVPQMPQRSGFNTLLQIANIGMGAAQTGMQFTAKGDKFLGFLPGQMET